MIIAGMATMPGRELSLARCCWSLYRQVDRLVVYGNGYETAAPFERVAGRVANILFVPGGTCDLGAAGKFLGLELMTLPEWGPEDLYLSVDDDFIYPADYAATMARGQRAWRGVVTLHGTIFPASMTGYGQRERHNIMTTVLADLPVEMGGTGAMAFAPHQLPLTLDDFTLGNNNDMELSWHARRHGLPIVTLAHPRGYVRYKPPSGFNIYGDAQCRHMGAMMEMVRQLRRGEKPVPADPAVSACFKPLTDEIRTEARRRLAQELTRVPGADRN